MIKLIDKVIKQYPQFKKGIGFIEVLDCGGFIYHKNESEIIESEIYNLISCEESFYKQFFKAKYKKLKDTWKLTTKELINCFDKNKVFEEIKETRNIVYYSKAI